MVEDLLRAPLFHQLSLVHEEHAVADLAGKAHLVRDDDHRHPLPRQTLHDIQHFADHFRVERRGRLVEKHHIRFHGQRAYDGHTLLLAAG